MHSLHIPIRLVQFIEYIENSNRMVSPKKKNETLFFIPAVADTTTNLVILLESQAGPSPKYHYAAG